MPFARLMTSGRLKCSRGYLNTLDLLKWRTLFRAQVGMRKVHRWGVVLIALPFLAVVLTGIVLQLKKEIDWVQPPTQAGSGADQTPPLSFEHILMVARTIPEAEIQTWADIDRLDVRPGDGMLKVRSRNRWEIQLDWQTGNVLHVAYRRSEWIESLHDGSWFHEKARLWVFLPSAIVVLFLWTTGIYLFGLPFWRRWRKHRRAVHHPRRPSKPATAVPLPRDAEGHLITPNQLPLNGRSEAVVPQAE